jgi:hypothetical protein
MATKVFLVAGQPKLKDKEMDTTARGFIYCLTKNQATALYNSMTASHTARDAIDATFHLYHSELSEADQERHLQAFKENSGGCKWMICTTGLGAGIDIPNIMAVVHKDYPYSFLQFLQETGRLGREGQSKVLSLIVTNDRAESQFMEDCTKLATENSGVVTQDVQRDIFRVRQDMGFYMQHGVLASQGVPTFCLRFLVHTRGGFQGEVMPCRHRSGALYCTACGAHAGQSEEPLLQNLVFAQGGSRPGGTGTSASAQAGGGRSGFFPCGGGGGGGGGGAGTSGGSSWTPGGDGGGSRATDTQQVGVEARGFLTTTTLTSFTQPGHEPSDNCGAGEDDNTGEDESSLDLFSQAAGINSQEARSTVTLLARNYKAHLQRFGSCCGDCLIITGTMESHKPHQCPLSNDRCVACRLPKSAGHQTPKGCKNKQDFKDGLLEGMGKGNNNKVRRRRKGFLFILVVCVSGPLILPSPPSKGLVDLTHFTLFPPHQILSNRLTAN